MTSENKPKVVVKVKGVSKHLTGSIKLHQFLALLVKRSEIEFNLSKWYKNLFLGKISVKDVAYTLRVTSNKRENMYMYYSGKDVFFYTKPYFYHKIEASTRTPTSDGVNIQTETSTQTPTSDVENNLLETPTTTPSTDGETNQIDTTSITPTSDDDKLSDETVSMTPHQPELISTCDENKSSPRSPQVLEENIQS